MRRIDYHRPRSLAEALELRGGIEGARWVAGGTDLLVQIKGGAPAPAALISLRSVPELAGIELAEGGRIGAGTTLAEILEHVDGGGAPGARGAGDEHEALVAVEDGVGGCGKGRVGYHGSLRPAFRYCRIAGAKWPVPIS